LKTATKKSAKIRQSPTSVILNIDVHPELRARLKASAALSGVTMVEKLHEILCNAFDRKDLAGQAPASSIAVSA
jgi:hypothetical protein